MKGSNHEKYLTIKELINKNEYKQALNKMRKLCALEPTNLNYRFELGKLELIFGNIVKARKIFESQINSLNSNFATLELARLEALCGNIDYARQLLSSLYNKKNRDSAIFESGRLEFSEENVSKARELFESLNSDYSSLELGKLEVLYGNIDSARELFDNLLKTDSKDLALLQFLKLEVSQENYAQAMDYFDSTLENDLIDPSLAKNYNFYIKYKMNELTSKDNPKNYFSKQVLNYSYDRAIYQIKYDSTEEARTFMYSKFNNDISIKDLYKLVRDQLSSARKVDFGILDKYIIDLEFVIGTLYNLPASKVEVTTISNTDKIMSMHPVLSRYQNKYRYGEKAKY